MSNTSASINTETAALPGSNTFQTNVQTLPNIAHQLPIKLNSSNYLLWQAQLLPLLHSYDLGDHVEGTAELPPSILPENQPNPTYAQWFRRDQLVLSWIIGSISEAFLLQIVGVRNAKLAWQKLV